MRDLTEGEMRWLLDKANEATNEAALGGSEYHNSPATSIRFLSSSVDSWHRVARKQIKKARDMKAQRDSAVKALQNCIKAWTDLAYSGDAGNWDPETDDHIIEARLALSHMTG